MNRRNLIKSILLTTCATGLGTSIWQHGLSKYTISDFKNFQVANLSPEDMTLIARLAPVILYGPDSDGLPLGDIKTIIRNIDHLIARLSPMSRDNLNSLFSTMNSFWGRPLLSNVWTSWKHATPEELNEFLEDWRAHILPDLRDGYVAIRQLVSASHYSEEKQWKKIGYPGPPF